MCPAVKGGRDYAGGPALPLKVLSERELKFGEDLSLIGTQVGPVSGNGTAAQDSTQVGVLGVSHGGRIPSQVVELLSVESF